MKRHPADVTADRLERHAEKYEHRLNSSDSASITQAITALRHIAADDYYEAGGG